MKSLKIIKKGLLLTVLLSFIFQGCSTYDGYNLREGFLEGKLRVFVKIDMILQPDDLTDEAFLDLLKKEASARAVKILNAEINEKVKDSAKKEKLLSMVETVTSDPKIFWIYEDDSEGMALVDFNTIGLYSELQLESKQK